MGEKNLWKVTWVNTEIKEGIPRDSKDHEICPFFFHSSISGGSFWRFPLRGAVSYWMSENVGQSYEANRRGAEDNWGQWGIQGRWWESCRGKLCDTVEKTFEWRKLRTNTRAMKQPWRKEEMKGKRKRWTVRGKKRRRKLTDGVQPAVSSL